MSYGDLPGVCKHRSCLMDAASDGYCMAHRVNTTCANCGKEEYEHVGFEIAGEQVKMCPTVLYKAQP